jgi:hypothetical protein
MREVEGWLERGYSNYISCPDRFLTTFLQISVFRLIVLTRFMFLLNFEWRKSYLKYKDNVSSFSGVSLTSGLDIALINSIVSLRFSSREIQAIPLMRKGVGSSLKTYSRIYEGSSSKYRFITAVIQLKFSFDPLANVLIKSKNSCLYQYTSIALPFESHKRK